MRSDDSTKSFLTRGLIYLEGENRVTRKERMPTESDSMPEAEVTLRLAFWLLNRSDGKTHADVAIDGAHVRISGHEQQGKWVEERVVFDIRDFLESNGCHAKNLTDEWRGTYTFEGHSLEIKSASGFDVKVRCKDKYIKAECKGGPFQPKRDKVAAIYAIAIMQAILSGLNAESEELWVAVPDSPAFESYGRRILRSSVFARVGITIALVGRSGVRILRYSVGPVFEGRVDWLPS